MGISANSAIMLRLAALKRFMKLSALQQHTLVRRRLPDWLQPRPVKFSRLKSKPVTFSTKQDGGGVVLTCVPHPTTGFGHRFSEWNTGLIVARKAGIPFLNAGLGEGWDDALGLTDKFSRAADYLKSRTPIVIRLPWVDWKDRVDAAEELALMAREVVAKTENTVVMLADGQSLYRQHESTRELQALYHCGKGHQGQAHPRDKVRIAVHIRRGDVARMKQMGRGDWQARFVDIAWFVQVLASTLAGLEQRPYEIEVFSQGMMEDFAELQVFRSLCFRLNADPVWTFHRMATADVLIVSPSSYSFNAGLFNPGIKIARSPWWHEIPRTDGWIPVHGSEPDGDQLASLVEEQILTRDAQA
jgi:hypothetical protein